MQFISEQVSADPCASLSSLTGTSCYSSPPSLPFVTFRCRHLLHFHFINRISFSRIDVVDVTLRQDGVRKSLWGTCKENTTIGEDEKLSMTAALKSDV